MTMVEVHDGFRFLVRDASETGHILPVEHPKRADALALLGDLLFFLARPFQWGRRYVARHRRGVVATVVGLALTAEHMVAFLMLGQQFLAVMSGLIGLLSIAIGITYHAMGA